MSRAIPRGDTIIFKRIFLSQIFFKTEPWYAGGFIRQGKNKKSPLKYGLREGNAKKCQKF